MTKTIERNSRIPSKQTQTFSTYAHNQTAVTIQVLEMPFLLKQRAQERGALDRTRGRKNRPGTYDLTGIPPAARGVPKVEMFFPETSSIVLQET
ncbi:hypothetical protein FOCC_FOCC002254 [Frankliniella occidentalis]|nr:hypothetical protein FOCC_FOCC002254 [Frankliniella occidentalis]